MQGKISLQTAALYDVRRQESESKLEPHVKREITLSLLQARLHNRLREVSPPSGRYPRAVEENKNLWQTEFMEEKERERTAGVKTPRNQEIFVLTSTAKA